MLDMEIVDQVAGFLTLSFDAKVEEDTGFAVKLAVEKDGESQYPTLYSTDIKAGEWTSYYTSVALPQQAFGADSIRLYFQGDSVGNYLLDNVVFESAGENWEQEANDRIDLLRKSDVVVRLEGPTSNDLVMEVRQLTQAFPFGTAVKSKDISACQVSGIESAFCDFTKDNFNWIVDTYRMKWKPMEPIQGETDTEIPDNMAAWAKSNGLTVRGHSILWAKKDNNPAWLDELEGEDFINAVYNRVDFTVKWAENITSNWDVINEMVDQPEGVHTYYLDKSGDPDFRRKIFQRVRDLSPSTTLFLNDYGIISDSYNRFAMFQQQIRDLLAQGAPIDAIGLQSHLKENVDHVGFKNRVEALYQEFGLPIWITEFDWNAKGTINDPDHVNHAKQVEDFYRIMYSLQPIQGIMMWGFQKEFGSLVDENSVPNLAGEAYRRLYHDEWRTNLVLDGSGDEFNFRGFRGDYAMSILNGEGVLVDNFEFSVTEDTNVVCINDDGPWNCSQQ